MVPRQQKFIDNLSDHVDRGCWRIVLIIVLIEEFPQMMSLWEGHPILFAKVNIRPRTDLLR